MPNIELIWFHICTKNYTDSLVLRKIWEKVCFQKVYFLDDEWALLDTGCEQIDKYPGINFTG